jgi:hypothetical protein
VAIGLFEISFGEVPESVRGCPIQCAMADFIKARGNTKPHLLI